MDEVEDLLARLRSTGRVWIEGSQPESAIAELEQALGLRMPPSYRDFLARFGAIGIRNNYVSGIIDSQPLALEAGGLYCDTLRFREEHALPHHLLVVQVDEDAPFCLSTSGAHSAVEYPLVCYELHSGHEQVMSPSFGDWLTQWLQLWIVGPRR